MRRFLEPDYLSGLIVIITVVLLAIKAPEFPSAGDKREASSVELQKRFNWREAPSLLGEDPFFRFTQAELASPSLPPESPESSYKNLRNPVAVSAKLARRCETEFREHWQERGNFRSFDPRNLTVIRDRDFYYRYHLLRVLVYPEGSLKDEQFYAVLFHHARPVRGASGRYTFPVVRRQGELMAVLNPGFKPETGRYQVHVYRLGDENKRIYTTRVEIRARPRVKARPGLGIMTLESTLPMDRVRVRGPFGSQGKGEKLLDWADLLGADTFWILASQASGRDRGISPATPHCKSSMGNVDYLGKLTRDKDLGFGAYIISFYTPHNAIQKAGYRSSLRYFQDTGTFAHSVHTSLASRKRVFDMVKFARKMEKHPDVDYIGFDFIRTGHSDGFELVDHVVDDMSVSVPEDWASRSKRQRMAWFARRAMRNPGMIALWRWWRAHRVATIINKVQARAHVSKPVWVFTLGWEHGKHHGQDPWMMLDAGCFADAAMLYEASGEQFRAMRRQWAEYFDAGKGNLLIGNCVDWKLNHHPVHAPIREFYDRNMSGLFEFVENPPALGMFWHDVGRAIWGRTGEYSGSEWAVTGASALTSLRERQNLFPFSVKLDSPLFIGRGRKRINLLVSNRSQSALSNLVIRLLPMPALVRGERKKLASLAPGESRNISLPLLWRGGGALRVLGIRLEAAGSRPYTVHRFVR